MDPKEESKGLEVSRPGPIVQQHQGEEIEQPAKLMRIAGMVRQMLDEARRAPLDTEGRRMLADIHQRVLRELKGILSEDLKGELDSVVIPFADDVPSDSELRVAQAQLMGWLEGLFHGIQAAIFTQQMQAQQQLNELQRPRQPGERGNYL